MAHNNRFRQLWPCQPGETVKLWILAKAYLGLIVSSNTRQHVTLTHWCKKNNLRRSSFALMERR